jgi:hypothetical protein
MERHDAKTAKALGEPDEELDGTAREVVGSGLEVHHLHRRSPSDLASWRDGVSLTERHCG